MGLSPVERETCPPAGLLDKGSVLDRVEDAIDAVRHRQDEAGTPFCVTVDGQTLEDQTVTVRDRDSLNQERIAADKIVDYVRDRMA